MKSVRQAALVTTMVTATMAVATAMASVPAAAQQRTQAGVAAEVERGVNSWQAGNPEQAVQIWRPLAMAGDPDAQFNLAQAYRLGRGIAADRAQAKDWYRRAATQGHPAAQANYGLILFEDGDQRGAMPWLQQAADRGDARAQYVVGTALFNGDLLPKDWPRAYALMTRASAGGLAPARNSLTEMDRYIPLDQRQRGTALARDLERAQAAANGGAPVQTAQRPSTSSSTPTPTPAPSAITRVDLPPSRPATPPPTPPARVADARPAPRPPAPPVTSAAGDWRIQLGAFSSQNAARDLWDSLKRRSSAFAPLQSYLIPVGSLTRLQAGPFATRAAADGACAAARSVGQACFSVRK